MKYAVETLNPTRVKLSVEVPFEELKPQVDAAYRKIASQITIPGFRKGKVPAAIIDQRVGRQAVLLEAVNEALPELYVRALNENEITPMSQPEMEMDDIEDGAAVTFRAELDVAPKIELPEFHGLEVKVKSIKVDDATVDEQMDRLRQRFGSLNPVERAAADADFVTIDLSAARDGEDIPEAQATGMSYQVGRGAILEGLDDALEGMSAGDERTFASSLVAGTHRGEQVDVTVKVTAVKEQVLPDLDDDFAQMASEFDTVDELRENLREAATRMARLEQANQAREAVLKKLMSLVEVPLPDAAVEAEASSRRAQLAEQLSYAGLTEADYLSTEDQSEEEYVAEVHSRAEEAMAAQLVLDEIARFENMGVSQEELTQVLIQKAQESGVSPDAYVKHAVDHNHLPELLAEVRRSKALAHVVESANVQDSNGAKVELKTLLPDGTYGEPGGEEEADPTAGLTSTDAAGGIVVSGDYAVVEDEE